MDKFDGNSDMDLYLDADLDVSDIDDDIELPIKYPREKVTKYVPTGAISKPQVPSLPNTLTAQLQEELQAVKNEQKAMLQELTAMAPMTNLKTSNSNPQVSSSQTANFASIQLHGCHWTYSPKTCTWLHLQLGTQFLLYTLSAYGYVLYFYDSKERWPYWDPC